MSATPTTEGSIVGYLRLDASDWNETLDRAEARARELGRTDPTITVDANIGDAMSKIEAVRAAEASLGGKDISFTGNPAKIDGVAAAQKRLETAERAAANAASTQYLAELRLDDVQGRRNKTAYLVASAEEAVARATRNAEAAETRHVAATVALTQAQQAAARSAMEEAGAQDTDAAALGGTNTARRVAIGRMGLMATGIAALVPITASLAGATVALGGSLAGMGVAGILAYKGISAQMDHGTVVGIQYTAGMDRLRGVFHQLSATSATRMLSAFSTAVASISMAMPQLNTQTGVFTGYLGRIGNDALQSTINGLRVLNPLFVQAGDYIEHVAQGFLQWTENGGLEKFATYAESTFPQVVGTIGSLAQMALHVVDAFAPWGGVMLTALKAVSDTINAIPTGALPIVATGAVAVYLAFSKWSSVKSAIDGVNGSLQGSSVSAKGAFTAIMQVAAAVDAMILQATAAATSGIRQWQGMTQGTDKWSESIRKGSISASELGRTLQATGGFWNDFSNNIDIAGTSVRPFYDNVKALDQALASATPHDAALAYQQLMEEGKKAGKSAADMAALFPAATAAIHAQKQAAEEATSAQRSNVQVVNQLADAASKAKDALSQYNQALQGLGKTSLDESSANIAYNQSLADATTALQQNGVTLDQNSQKGRDNQRALDGIASSAIALIAAHQAAGVSQNQLTSDMATARQAFIDTATKMGMTADRANHLADQYQLIPKSVDTAFSTSGVAQAEADAAAVKAAYDTITRQITIRVNTILNNATNPNVGFGLGNGHQAGGWVNGTVYRAGGGGIPDFGSMFRPQGTDTVPMMATPGEFVVKQKSASYDPGFLNAYNSNPQAALASARSQGQTVVSLKGATLVMQVDGRQFTAVIQDQIVAANRKQKAGLEGGMQEVAL